MTDLVDNVNGEPLAPKRSRDAQPPLGRIISNIDEKDAESRYREEAAVNNVAVDPHQASSHSDASDGEETIVAWEKNDPENPYNWAQKKKSWVVAIVMIVIINSTMGSSLPSNAIPFMAKEWGVTSDQEKVLPMSVYLIGYVLGPFLWAPLSEQFGRRDITIYTFVGFTLATLACALAPSWAAFLVFRLFAGIFASAPIGTVTGIIADMYGNPLSRGRAMAVFMSMTVFGPLIAPVISGYCSPTLGWRWTFWIGLIYAGFSMVLLVTLPETYGPILLLWRAKKIRKADPKARVLAPHELERKTLTELTTVVLTRPLRMIVFEPIVSTTCLYLALVYAIFYMSFQAFPIIFQGVYGLSPGEGGLTYMAVGVGSLLGLPFFWGYGSFLERAKARNAPWTHKEEYMRLPVGCIGGPMFAIALFWLGWSARAEVSFVVPLLAGIPFGFGFVAIFMALLNYLTDAYEIFAASASAAASGARSLIATVLPLATTPMFARLGISGACSLLGGLSLLMSIVPFIFIWQGQNIRASSPFCIALKQRKVEMEQRIEEQRQRKEQRVTSERDNGASHGSKMLQGVLGKEEA